ncbi:glutamic acid-rich protein-like isoform X2 [Rhinatrema bivittatum]|uniref:glutamic acid-rich protein-like isoform X2 n=1 Tax=Rhinatrema bivittatum TaxID=194408 RepID=UPI00112E7F40|nr:glutamic acid-rich protein-like isoform X2 [Rhinatrema bivittatum]
MQKRQESSVRINYKNLDALCNINGLQNSENPQTTEDAHKMFMEFYPKIFDKDKPLQARIPTTQVKRRNLMKYHMEALKTRFRVLCRMEPRLLQKFHQDLQPAGATTSQGMEKAEEKAEDEEDDIPSQEQEEEGEEDEEEDDEEQEEEEEEEMEDDNEAEEKELGLDRGTGRAQAYQSAASQRDPAAPPAAKVYRQMLDIMMTLNITNNSLVREIQQLRAGTAALTTEMRDIKGYLELFKGSMDEFEGPL